MQRQPLAASQRDRIAAGLPFVEALARRMAASMPHSIDLGDLVQDGVLGLIDAAHRFDEARGIKFETFAERRVRGAMIDALRKDAWPRGVRRQRRELEAAREAAAPRARRTSRRWRTSPRASAPTRSAWAAPSSASTPSSRRRRSPPASTSTSASLPPALVPSEPESPGHGLRDSAKSRDRVRAAIAVAAAARAQGHRPLLLRRSHDEADRRRDRRQRVARLAAARARDPPAARRRSAPMVPPARGRGGAAPGDPRVPADDAADADGEGDMPATPGWCCRMRGGRPWRRVRRRARRRTDRRRA